MSVIDARTLRRMLSAYGRTVQDADPDDLADLVALDEHLHSVITSTVTHMREHQGFTWATIGSALGITRQAAQQRFGG